MDGVGLIGWFRRPGGAFPAIFAVMSLGLLSACATGNGFSSSNGGENRLTLTPLEITAVNPRPIPAGRYVFNDPQEWSRFWAKYHEKPAPNVDLDESTLVAVFLGYKPHVGYSVGIVGATEHEEEVVVDVVEYLPEAGMMYAQMIVYPFAMALLPKTGREIRFEVSEQSGRP